MHFVIAGCTSCPQFTYAVMVAQRLKENLPDFTYLKIPKKPEDWDRWLVEICRENDWHHIKSPLIWREVGVRSGKKDLVGDINKFLDLCSDYYGIPQDILSAEQFSRGEMKWFTHRTESEFFETIKEEAKKRREYRSRQVCITGASSQMTEVIVMELLEIEIQKRENGLEIRLFDQPKHMCKLVDKALDAKQCPGPSGFGNCRVVHSMKEAFSNVDLVIVLDCFPRKAKESLVKWLKRNRNAMCVLGKALNKYAPPHCRVIIGSPSTQAICYNATVLASFATNLHVRNIVAVTQDLGRETLRILAEKSKTPIKNFYCPPVWGFVGLNKFIDLRRTLQTHLYKVPGKRAHSTLPQGTEEYELRMGECLLSEEDTDELLSSIAQHKAHTFSQLGRWPYLAKVTAILDLLKVWGLKQEDGNGEILCLGVYSDGTFNIPKGIYWSQPVILSEGFWVPFKDFPIPRSRHFNAFYLFLLSVAAVYRTKVKPRMYIPPKREPEPKEKKKFNFDKIAEEVGMPPIKTDVECVMYLKYLAKKELGIDLDQVLQRIDEETETEELPTEEVVKEQIYCECWRQELKELQKVVFDRSSTTEVEVDLSDNISGSEWSIINVPSKSDLVEEVSFAEKKDSDTTDDSLKPMRFLHTTDDSPPSTVCSCGRLSTGSLCQCLVPPPKEGSTEERISTEHFYKEQNAQIYEEDLKDVIYADTYAAEKHVTFDADAKQEDETGFQFKFYGKKDAVRDKEADLKMQKRIARYERGEEDSYEEELERPGEKEGSLGESGKTESVDINATKFQVSIQGTSFDIIGDQSGLDSLEEMRSKSPGKGSSTTFKEMYADEVTSSIHFIPPVDKSTESSERDLSYSGEGQYTFGSDFKDLPEEIPGEKTFDRASITSLEEDLDTVWGEQESVVEIGIQEEKPEKKARRKREGIPLCCLCRCLVPEGLPCCPCGATTVVEVFRKESIEIIIQSEDDIRYTVQYYESPLRQQGDEIEERETEEGSGEGEIEEDETTRGLPPESFLPFSPKRSNVFKEAVRPFELTKEYADSFKKIEPEVPQRCLELMAEAKMKLDEMELQQGEYEEAEEVAKDDDKENLPPICEEPEHIKTEFSDLKLFIPCGLEDWRLTVQRKYRDWFFQGPKIKDETYYDVAIEEVSDDEFEVDKELEQFFEN